MKIKNFNDVFGLILGAVVFPALWALGGTGIINLPTEAASVTYVLETLIVQFYFRKALDSGTK